MALVTEMIPSESRPDDKKFEELPHHELLIKPPFTMVITGSIGSGKSSLIWSMLNPSRGFYKKYFDYILIFNGSLDSNKVWKDASTDKNVIDVENTWDNDKFQGFLTKLEREQMRREEEGEPLQRVCVVFDDAVTKGISNRHKINSVDDAFQRCRHLSLSLICATQCYRQLNRSQRSLNTLAFVITKVNYMDLMAIAEEHAGLIKPDTFIKMYRKCMKQKEIKHPFLVVNYQREPDERYWCTFNHLIKIKAEDDVIPDESDEKPDEEPVEPVKKSEEDPE